MSIEYNRYMANKLYICNPDKNTECTKENCFINGGPCCHTPFKEYAMVLKKSPEVYLQDSGDRTEFESGAVRDMHEGKGRFDLLPMCVLMRLAKHFERGSVKYGDRNWEKGIPSHSYLDSAMRHICKYADGWNDEDHLISAIWNLCCLAWNEEKRPDLMDIPAREPYYNTSNAVTTENPDEWIFE